MSLSNTPFKSDLIWQHHKKKASGKPTIASRNQVATAHQALVRKIAHSVAAKCAVEYEDLEQIGMIGLLKAVEKFDATKGVSFSSFAVPYIRGEMLHHLRDHGSNVKVARRDREKNAQANKVERMWFQQHGKLPSESQVADQIGVTVDRLRQVRAAIANQQAMSLAEDFCEVPQPEQHTDEAAQDGRLEQAWSKLRTNFSTLPASEQELLRLVFVQRATQKALSDRFNLPIEHLQRKLGRILHRIAN